MWTSRNQTRIYNANRFKLGLFGMNCSGGLSLDEGARTLGRQLGEQREGGKAC